MSPEEEAQKLYLQGRSLYESGNLRKAIAVLNASLERYETRDASELLGKCEVMLRRGASTARPQEPMSPPPPRREYSNTSNTNTRSTGTPRPQPPPQPQSTPKPQPSQSQTNNNANNTNTGGNPADQAKRDAIRINSLSDHYAILNVPRNATDDEIKRSYRKLAIKLHPDKNPAPEAEEAFKKLNLANDVLSDPQKRRIYDETGSLDGTSQGAAYSRGGGGGGGGHGGHRHQQHFYTNGQSFHFDGMDINDVLSELFGGGFGGGFRQQHHRRTGTAGERQQHRQRQQQAQNIHWSQYIIQFLPFILLIVFSLSSSLFASSQPDIFSISQNTDFAYARHTARGSTYYVGPQFHYKYGRDGRVLREVEHNVDREYLERYQELCNREKFSKRKHLEDLKRQGKDIYSISKNMKLPSCEKFADIKKAPKSAFGGTGIGKYKM